MKTLAVAVLCALLMGCAVPTPSGVPSPATTPGASPSAVVVLVCTPAPVGAAPASGDHDSCLTDEIVLETAVARFHRPVQKIAILSTGFPCAPFYSGAMSCVVFADPIGAYVAFDGTPEVAALTIDSVPNKLPVATLVAFKVPPVGWSMP